MNSGCQGIVREVVATGENFLGSGNRLVIPVTDDETVHLSKMHRT